MKQLLWHHGLILLVCLVVFFANLGGPRLWDRDEPRNAGCAWEMQQRHDWVVPIFNARLRDAKPVLLYWLIMAAYSLFGVNEFAARFPSALLAVGTVLATYHIGRRLFSSQAALWGAIALSTALMFNVAARAATPDSVLIFFSTLALLFYVLGTFPNLAQMKSNAAPAEPLNQTHYFPSSWIMVVGMYAAMGMGVLAKGPVGLVLPTAVIGMFLLIMRLPAKDKSETAGEDSLTSQQADVVATRSMIQRLGKFAISIVRPFAPHYFLRTCWSMRPMTAMAVVLAIAAPWYWWVGVRTEGDFLVGFFVKEHFGRATSAMENHHGSIWFYPVTILVGFFPWSVFAGPTLIDLFKRVRNREPGHVGYIFLTCWVCVYVGLFTIAQTKLPSYITPCYPALALLTGCFIYHWSRHRALASRIWPQLSMLSLGIVGAAILIAFPIAASRFLPGDEWLAAIGLIPLIAAVCSFVFLKRGNHRISAITFAVSAVLFVTGLFGYAAQRVDHHQKSHLLLGAIAQRSDHPRIASFGCLESSWIFYGKHPIVELDLKHTERKKGVRNLLPDRPAGYFAQKVPDPFFSRDERSAESRKTRNWDPPPREDIATFFSRQGDTFLITTGDRLSAVQKELPSDVHVLVEAPYFLKDHRLVVLGRDNNHTKSALKPTQSRGPQ